MSRDLDRIRDGLAALGALLQSLPEALDALQPIVDAMRRASQQGGTLFFAGNGGSAADAQHLAAEYMVRYHGWKHRGVRAVALTTDSSVLTAAANDFGYEQVFARQLEVLARPGDVLILHSTSGDSPNCIVAAERARALGVTTVALLGGDGGRLRGIVHHAFVVPDRRVNHVQEVHLALQHQIAAILTEESGR
jgi:D-sedoheptulose 7-phosphate isomerase